MLLTEVEASLGVHILVCVLSISRPHKSLQPRHINLQAIVNSLIPCFGIAGAMLILGMPA